MTEQIRLINPAASVGHVSRTHDQKQIFTLQVYFTQTPVIVCCALNEYAVHVVPPA